MAGFRLRVQRVFCGLELAHEKGAGTQPLGPSAFPSLLKNWRVGYFCDHSQKFHQTPVWFGIHLMPVTRSL